MLATVTVRAERTGTTALSFTGARLVGDENEDGYGTTFGSTTLTVIDRAAPDVTGNDEPATDPDGDRDYEDVTGDGTFDVLDVATLLDEL